jgi:hypothetical protein
MQLTFSRRRNGKQRRQQVIPSAPEDTGEGAAAAISSAAVTARATLSNEAAGSADASLLCAEASPSPRQSPAREHQLADGESNLPSCVICCDPLAGELAAITCGHVFHRSCIMKWFCVKPSCPSCKAEVVIDRVQVPTARKECFDLFFDCVDGGRSDVGTAPRGQDTDAMAALLAAAKTTVNELMEKGKELGEDRDALMAKISGLQNELQTAKRREEEMRPLLGGAKALKKRELSLMKELKVRRIFRRMMCMALTTRSFSHALPPPRDLTDAQARPPPEDA